MKFVPQKMNQNQEGPSNCDVSGKFHIVQPHRDLESNWAVDLAKSLEDYLLKICSGEITGEDDSHLSVNFAEAALLLQGSIQVYSRKVEYLYSLVLHALEFVTQKSQPEEPENSSVQPDEGGLCAARDEEDDPFWGLDDIPVETKNTLDSATSRDATLDYFRKPPADLVVLEGDCLDASGDGGELESYLLATNDIYRDFILLDSCDAAAVDDFLMRDDEAVKGQNGVSRGSSMPSKHHKSFQSPTRQSRESIHKLSVGNSQDANLNRSPGADHGFEFNLPYKNFHSPACNIPENNHTECEMDGGYSGFGDLDDSDDNDDDPWKPLNPHQPGTLKVKPFRKVKAYGGNGLNSSKQVSITTEFPLARLHGTISFDLSEIWESHRHALERQQQSRSPPLYEKLRQSLVLGEHGKYDTYFNPLDDNEDNGYDSGDAEPGLPDLDMPENTYMNEDHDDGSAHFNTDEASGHDDPTPDVNLEDLCWSHLDSLLVSISETEKQTELATRVSTWKQRIEQNLEEQDSLPPFDIHQYGEKILDKLSLATYSETAMSFTDVVRGQKKHDVARTFSALLQLVNNRNVDLQRVDTNDDEHTCYTAGKPFHIRLLRHAKRRQEVQLRSSKKRAKSLIKKGEIKGGRDKAVKGNHRQSVRSPPLASTSSSMPSEMSGKFSPKLGKVGSIRCTPESERKRRSKFVEPVELHSAR